MPIERAAADLLLVRLEAVLAGIGQGIAIAVSGGVDSLTLATVAHRTRGPECVMYHAVSPAVPGDATARVERLAAEQGWRLSVIDAGEFGDADYRANPVDRCFFCKTNLYGAIGRHTGGQILSGANLDDLGEYRPGLAAARDHRVRHPYLEAGIDKAGVRSIARLAGLGGLSALPASPCLSSRVETGIAIRPDILRAIHEVERDLARDFPYGVVRCRVRASGIVVELDPVTLAAVRESGDADLRTKVASVFAPLLDRAGLSGDTIELEPYRNGSAFLHATAPAPGAA